MTMTITELGRILVECAGGDEVSELREDASEVTFEELGYDSLALIETASRIQRDYGVQIPEDLLVEVKTPRELIDIINDQLRGAA
ncbi:acyl carrier protein [Nocardia asteroides]|uniref:acyl carrier protein n=1 Tax=Nocardia asteroides TaxID=1824 RepID=UPI001E63896E|nr:acyl carrier protein [Nocardia asteroides]UGT63386.1 acyl carrier protein [Nocardia asteroides]